MQAGRLNTRVTLQRRTAGQDAAGQPIDGWADVATTWADFRVLQGLEAIRADATTATSRASCRLRWRDDLAPDMRVLVGSQPWAIVSVQPDVGRRRFVDLVLERTQ